MRGRPGRLSVVAACLGQVVKVKLEEAVVLEAVDGHELCVIVEPGLRALERVDVCWREGDTSDVVDEANDLERVEACSRRTRGSVAGYECAYMLGRTRPIASLLSPDHIRCPAWP